MLHYDKAVPLLDRDPGEDTEEDGEGAEPG
jgi:hypothetical protein